MKLQIKSWLNGAVLFELETETMRLCVEAAINSRANLSGANLYSANLYGAKLSGANLSGANLYSANLYGAKLSGADLSGADLSGANLSGANLSGADLSGADLYGANLYGADLSGARGLKKHLITPLMILLDQPGEICAYKLVNANDEGPFNGGIKYLTGETVSVKANTNDTEQCASGINLATLDWCMKEWRESRKILKCYFTAADIACIPIATDGKFRVHRCRVGELVNLELIGLIEPAKQEAT